MGLLDNCNTCAEPVSRQALEITGGCHTAVSLRAALPLADTPPCPPSPYDCAHGLAATFTAHPSHAFIPLPLPLPALVQKHNTQ